MLHRKFEKGHCRGILSASRVPMKALYIYGVRAIDENRGVVKFHKPNPQTSLTSWISSSCFVGSFRHGRWKKYKSSSAYCKTYVGKKRIFLCVIIYNVCFLCLVSFLCLQFLEETKNAHQILSVESSTALVSSLSGSGASEFCLAFGPSFW